MLSCIFGIFLYLIFDSCVERCNERKKSLAIATTHLTDKELMSLDEQCKMLDDESKMAQDQVEKINMEDLKVNDNLGMNMGKKQAASAQPNQGGTMLPGQAAAWDGDEGAIRKPQVLKYDQEGPTGGQTKQGGLTQEQIANIRKRDQAGGGKKGKRRRFSYSSNGSGGS